ncbi:MAG: tRNA (adenosine(37)-N6)-threonylcarbamoyltransferase complex dimerization subunit type 1 TsaB [Syntrophomonadaceae bacterium]|jgi:tRNA threonylcarbamoyladenosine biosynthesis protein TsaB
MLILAIDSATPVAGVALADEEKIIIEDFINYKKTHSETLLPMIDSVIKAGGSVLADIDVIAVTIGPGSFTGLRIGLATVKGLSMAANLPVVAVPTLEAVAANLAGCNALVYPLMDARKNEVYTAPFDVAGKYPRQLGDTMACSPEEAAASAIQLLQDTKKNSIILIGEGYLRYKDYFQQKLRDWLLEVPQHLLLPRPAAVASLGLKRFQEGLIEEVLQLRPLYIRLSEAERRLGGQV